MYRTSQQPKQQTQDQVRFTKTKGSSESKGGLHKVLLFLQRPPTTQPHGALYAERSARAGSGGGAGRWEGGGSYWNGSISRGRAVLVGTGSVVERLCSKNCSNNYIWLLGVCNNRHVVQFQEIQVFNVSLNNSKGRKM